MTLQDAGYSLKLECALRNLGFVEFEWKVIAHAGIFFVLPVSFTPRSRPCDELLGFQIQETEEYNSGEIVFGKPIIQSAKKALDFAMSFS